MTISYIGYKTVNLATTDQTLVKVVLEEDSKMIDEVVVSRLWSSVTEAGHYLYQ